MTYWVCHRTARVKAISNIIDNRNGIMTQNLISHATQTFQLTTSLHLLQTKAVNMMLVVQTVITLPFEPAADGRGSCARPRPRSRPTEERVGIPLSSYVASRGGHFVAKVTV